MKSQGTTYKRCGCRTGLVPARNKDGTPKLRADKPVMVCPKLKSGRHGSWFWALRVEKDKPPVRKGGFETQEAAQKDLDEFKRLRGLGLDVSGGAETPFEQYWDKWLLGKAALSPKSRDSYAVLGDLYLKPALGPVAVGELRKTHADLMFTAMRLIGEQVPTSHPAHAEHTRLMAARKPWTTRKPGVGSMHRVLTALNSVMNSAVRNHDILWNPMQHVELEPERQPEALLWTDQRVAEWRRTGKRPGPVMVWTAEQTGEFLDAVVDDPLYPYWHLLAYRGLRRGEGVGARWDKLDWDLGVLDVDEQMYRASGLGIIATRPKAASDGKVALDEVTLLVLREQEKRQKKQRLAAGDTWHDTGLIFTREDGRGLEPDDVTRRFRELVTACGLPPIRLHDLRHGAASLTYAVTRDLKIVQKLLRHKVPAMTHRYTTLFEQVDKDSAEKSAAFVPRRRVPTAFPQTESGAVIPAQFPKPDDGVSAGQQG